MISLDAATIVLLGVIALYGIYIGHGIYQDIKNKEKRNNG